MPGRLEKMRGAVAVVLAGRQRDAASAEVATRLAHGVGSLLVTVPVARTSSADHAALVARKGRELPVTLGSSCLRLHRRARRCAACDAHLYAVRPKGAAWKVWIAY